MATAYDKLIKVTITQPGMQTYNGYLRKHLFKDGKSVEAIPVRMALLLGASCSVEDENGNTLSPNTYVFENGVGEVSAADFPSVKSIRVGDIEAAAIAEVEEESGPELSDGPMPDPEVITEDDVVGFSAPGDEFDDPKVWSLAELEAIADAEGINGLREVGDILEVKGRSIDDLIQSILKIQISEPADDSEGKEVLSESDDEDSGE